MNLIRTFAVLVFAIGCSGCGNDAKPPTAAPPPAFKPAPDALLENAAAGQGAAAGQDAAGADNAVPAAGTENEVADGDSPAEDETASDEKMVDDDREVAAPGNVASADVDEPAAGTTDAGAEDAPATVADQPAKAKSGKWMRGLTNAFDRAFSKSLDQAAKSKGAAARPPAAEDDPFPNGEPDSKKPNE
jgi:hypothetical protein